jgi:hypothetical protein
MIAAVYSKTQRLGKEAGRLRHSSDCSRMEDLEDEPFKG